MVKVAKKKTAPRDRLAGQTYASRRASGRQQIMVWLEPEDAERIESLKKRFGYTTKDLIATAIKRLETSLRG